MKGLVAHSLKSILLAEALRAQEEQLDLEKKSCESLQRNATIACSRLQNATARLRSIIPVDPVVPISQGDS
jgi:hypothetical protein